MLKHTIVCAMLVAAVAIAWEQMAPVDDPAAVGSGSAITYGDGKVWGVFPDTSEDSMATYFEYYDPSQPPGSQWVYPGEDQDLDFLSNTAITFQWRFGGEVLVVGNADGDPYYPTLYCYDLADSSWDEEDIEYFFLGAGASIAFRPAPPIYGDYVAGFMYCLAGGGKGFWCYSVPGLGDITVDGICPEESSLIADQTPTFIWPVVGSAQKYGLAVSLNPDMSSPVLQDSTNDTCYEVTEKLTNGTYYWQSASRQGATWTWSAVHSFTLDGGWTRLADVPVDVTYGASLAYEKDFYNNEECLIAFTAGEQYLAVYSVAGNSWSHDISTPKPQGIGSAIVTHEAASSTPPDWAGPWAVFGEYSDSLWYHTNDKPGWIRYNDAGEFPQSLGSGASLAYGIESGTHYLYLIVGDNGSGPRNDFYRQELPTSGGGGQAGSTRPASASARLISRAGKVTVEYQLSVPAQVRATVFDALGRQVELLDAGAQAVGVHQLSWDTGTHGRRPSAGACFVVLDIGDQRASLKAVVK